MDEKKRMTQKKKKIKGTKIPMLTLYCQISILKKIGVGAERIWKIFWSLTAEEWENFPTIQAWV